MTRRLGRAGALALLLAVASAPAAAADEPVKTIDHKAAETVSPQAESRKAG